MSKPCILAVAGPTATGKSALGIALCKALGGEVISADSMQIYKGLDIGTAKVTPEEMQGIPHYGIDILAPEQPYSVVDFCEMAKAAAAEITARGHIPVLVGGTGLYLESFLGGIRFAPDKIDPALRESLAAELAARGAETMYHELESVDPEAAHATHPNNTVRVLRALEHYRATGETLSEQKRRSRPAEKPYRALIFGLDYPQRAELYAKIDARVDMMVQKGLLAEARRVYEHRDTYKTAAQAIGYKELFPYFEGVSPPEPCVAQIKQASRNYAKRQLTWFRRMEDIHWLAAGDASGQENALRQAAEFWKGDTVQ